MADTMSLTGRRVTYFERGLVLTGPDPGQPVVVSGPIYLRYRELDDIPVLPKRRLSSDRPNTKSLLASCR